MEKSKIIIISTNRALTLAGVLSHKLNTDFSEAIIWREEIEGQVSLCVKEMLENAAKGSDCAVIILTRQDIDFREGNDEEERQALDNLFYEAGLFIATLGLERCFLVSNAEVDELPFNFEPRQYLHFEEPIESADIVQLGKVIDPSISIILRSLSEQGKLLRQETLPLLPAEKVFERERHKMKDGQLHEGYVMVCDAKPFEENKYTLQVKQNLDLGITYLYFFHANDDNAKKICALLKIILLADQEGKPPSGESEEEVILGNLKKIIQRNSLNVYFMKTAPAFRFRIHNASDPQNARAYLRYGESDYFVQWQEGVNTSSMWNFFINFTKSSEKKALFRSSKTYELYDKEKGFLSKLKQEISTSFPQIQAEMIELCFEPENKRKVSGNNNK